MISSSKLRGLLIAVLVLLFPILAKALPSVMQRGNFTVAKESVFQDIVVADGNLIIAGRVDGSVFLVNGEVLINAGGVVKGNLTVLGGNLWVAAGSVVEGEINVFSGQAQLEPGAKVGPQVRVMENVPALTPEKLLLISRYVIFSRPVPPDTYPLSSLSLLHADALRLRRVREQRAARLDLFELGRLPFNPGDISDAYEALYHGREFPALCLVQAVRFNSPAALKSLWDRMRNNFEDKTSYSVHNSLGDGAHWFFRYRSSSYCLWYSGRTLMAVVVRHDDDHPDPQEWKQSEDLRDRVTLELANLFGPERKP